MPYQEIIDSTRPNTWENLKRLSSRHQAEWIQKYFKDILKTLVSLNESENRSWHVIGCACINNNLYKEAEQLYDELVKSAGRQHKSLSLPAYYRGIAHFLQGRFQDAYADFKLARQSDLQMKNFSAPSAQAIAYMEDTLFPTREMIKKNQASLIKDLNASRVLGHTIGPNMLRTIHKWNSATPLFSHGISQGGGYFLTMKNGWGEVKGIAVDPGYDFFDIFRDMGMGIADIDAMIITHDHDDHTESVEGILSLLAKYNDHNEQKKTKIVDIFGSAGALLKFHGLLSATDLFGNREINFKLLVPGSDITEVEGVSLKEKYGFTLSVNPAHHTERWTNQESSVGLILHTNITCRDGNLLKIGITGDTRYEVGQGFKYRDVQLLLLNIGSVEKEEGKLLTQHLGMLGCINLLKEARLGKPLLAVLTEFGEEFSGRREIISHIIENWAQPMEGTKARELRVIPADIHLEVRLEDLSVRETDTNVFFPYNLIKVDESNPEVLSYRFNG